MGLNDQTLGVLLLLRVVVLCSLFVAGSFPGPRRRCEGVWVPENMKNGWIAFVAVGDRAAAVSSEFSSRTFS